MQLIMFEDKLKLFEVMIRIIIMRNHFADFLNNLLVSNCHNVDINHVDQYGTLEIKNSINRQNHLRKILSKNLVFCKGVEDQGMHL